MDHQRKRLLREALQRVSQRMMPRRYHPEKFYMRGPGPKTLAKIGEMFRAETEDVVREPMPQHWLDLIHAAEKRMKKCD